MKPVYTFFHLFFSLLFLPAVATAQSGTVAVTLEWHIDQVQLDETRSIKSLTFTDAAYDSKAKLPAYIYNKQVTEGTAFSFEIKNPGFEPLSPEEISALLPEAMIPEELTAVTTRLYEKKKPYDQVRILPVIRDKATGILLKVTYFEMEVLEKNAPQFFAKNNFTWSASSQLATGKWAKLFVNVAGIYSLSFDYIKNLGLNVSGTNISQVRIYGYGSGMLPENNALTKYDDLEELAIEVKDNNGNALFDAGDEVLFYGEGPDAWKFNTNDKRFYHQSHLYSNHNCYFITIGATGGKRISSLPPVMTAPSYTTGSGDGLYFHESDQFNLIKSGKRWVGEEFDRVTSYDFSLTFSGLRTSDPIFLYSLSVARSPSVSSMRTTINGSQVLSQSMNGVNIYDYTGVYTSNPLQISTEATVNSTQLNINYTYPKTGSSKAWLDYFGINYRRDLQVDNQLVFRDKNSIGNGNISRFDLTAGNTLTVWDISNRQEIHRISVTSSGNNHSFTVNTDSLREFTAFTGASYLTPFKAEAVENQDLHSLSNIDYVIVSHPDLVEQAERLADFHRAESGLTVYVVTPQKIYNEFSSGIQDISGIRNFMRMLYDKAATGKEPRYLLLFGDASYDYKDNQKNNTNFVPTYESDNSHYPDGSFCSDDFFVLLDESDGADITIGALDVGVGRLPVQKAATAKQVVDKMIGYHSPASFGDWKNTIALVADDEDYNNHLNDAEGYAALMEPYKPYNVTKIYADAYKQISVGNGGRYPDMVTDIDKTVNNGALVVNYSGHGGELGLGHEKFVEIAQINSWHNAQKLPLFITATCEFSRFDDPARTSAGEYVLLNPNGGSVAMFTTVRLVYAGPNKTLNDEFYKNNAFAYDPSDIPAIGDIYLKMQNRVGGGINSKCFTLLGDPAMKLAYPKHLVKTLTINGKNILVETDTLRALSKVTITGEVTDRSGNKLSGFNGTLSPTVFGRKQKLKTLANDPTSYAVVFDMYKSILYKGKAQIQNGSFTYSFVVPQDMPIESGIGKISYYAENGIEDAHGYTEIYVSPEIDPTAQQDNEGPVVRLFMNDTTFRYGGITDQNPSLLARIADEHGINATGNGIGRDIIGVLDGNYSNTIVLNQYYTATMDDYQSGEIRYPLSKLTDGHHTLQVKVWDVYNNSGEGYTEFIVASSDKIALTHIMAMPNPMYDNTVFSFEHNKTGQHLTVEIEIYDVQGKLHRKLSSEIPNASATVAEITWDGETEGGSRLRSGTYIYRVNLKSADGSSIQKSERLVVIR